METIVIGIMIIGVVYTFLKWHTNQLEELKELIEDLKVEIHNQKIKEADNG